MADKYTIDFTDQNTNRSFVVSPFGVNGPLNPTSGALDPKATSAATSLRLVGKGLPEYGERVLENLVHLMEHFSGNVEPTYPINGQVWFNKQLTPQQLCVYNSLFVRLDPTPNHPADAAWYAVSGDLVTRLSATPKIRITQSTTGVQEEYTISDVMLIDVGGADKTEFKISPAPSTSRVTWYLGGWEYVLQNNAPLRANFDANNYRILNLGSPTLPSDAVNMEYVLTKIDEVNNTIGNLVLDDLFDVNVPLPLNNHVLAYDNVSGTWVSRTVSAVGAFLSSGGTITGDVTIDGNLTFAPMRRGYLGTPAGGFVSPAELVNKQYVDSAVSAGAGAMRLSNLLDVGFDPLTLLDNDILRFDIGSGLWTSVAGSTFIAANMGGPYVQISGDTLTGFLTLHADPTANMHAATKRYVDNAIAGIPGGSGSEVTGGEYSSEFDTLTLHQSGGAIVSLPVTAYDHTADTFTVDGDYSSSFTAGVSFNLVCTGSPGSTTNYTVEAPGATYNIGTHETVIPVTDDLLSGMVIAGCEITDFGSYDNDVTISMPITVDTSDLQHTVEDPSTYPSQYDNYIWENALIDEVIAGSRTLGIKGILSEIGAILGTFAEPKFRAIVATTGNATYQVSGMSYVGGTNDLAVYLNGVKQIASERGWRSAYGATKKWPSMSTGLLNTTTYGFNVNVDGAGNVAVKFNGQYGITYNDLVKTLNSLGNTNAVLTVAAFNEATNILYISGDVASLFPSGKTFNMDCVGPPVTTLSYTTSAAATYSSATGVTTVPVTANLLIPSLKVGVSTYAVVSYTATPTPRFVISGNQTGVFTSGLAFTAEGASNPVYSTGYTVSFGGSTYDGTNTTIPVDGGIYSYGLALSGCTVTGVGLGFGVIMSDGRLKFVSDSSGNGSSVGLTDGASGATNLFSTLFGTPQYANGGTVATDYAYMESCSVGEISDTFEFHAASIPSVGSTIEIIVDRRIIR